MWYHHYICSIFSTYVVSSLHMWNHHAHGQFIIFPKWILKKWTKHTVTVTVLKPSDSSVLSKCWRKKKTYVSSKIYDPKQMILVILCQKSEFLFSTFYVSLLLLDTSFWNLTLNEFFSPQRGCLRKTKS